MATTQTLSSSSITGDKVKNHKGEDLGEIKDLMIDLASGRVSYAVLSFGGFLGMGDKLFAIPMDALVLDSEEKCFLLSVDKEMLKDAPGFDKDNWPDMSDRQWGQNIHQFYNHKPYWQ